MNLTHEASPFLLSRVITLVMLKPSGTGSNLPFQNDWGTEEIRLVSGGSMDTREERDSSETVQGPSLLRHTQGFQVSSFLSLLQFLETN